MKTWVVLFSKTKLGTRFVEIFSQQINAEQYKKDLVSKGYKIAIIHPKIIDVLGNPGLFYKQD